MDYVYFDFSFRRFGEKVCRRDAAVGGFEFLVQSFDLEAD
jgi:hypothetical protein